MNPQSGFGTRVARNPFTNPQSGFGTPMGK
jgi:hypothetical protein